MEYPDTRDVADIIKNAGGVACLAHPGHYDSLDLAWELARDGKIQAIELSHPRNSDSDREEIEKIIGDKLPNTAHRKSEWWSNNDKTHSQSSSWSDVGYKTTGIRLGESITFKKI